MSGIPLDIIEFIKSPYFLNDQSLSEAQIALLKSIYGLSLTDRELEIYRRGTGRETYDATEQREVTGIAGRRSGKTGKIAAPIVCYQACREYGIPPGEYAYVMLLAPTIAQSRIAFRYVRAYFLNSPILSKKIVRMTKDEITLNNNIIIGCYSCVHSRIRGKAIVAAICDEIAHWPDGAEAANSPEEVLEAIRPGMATIRNAKLIKISTPFSKRGILWDEFRKRGELDICIWQLTTFELNPTVTPKMVERERSRNEEKYRQEYLAEFTDSISTWIVPEVLNPCIVRGRRDLPPQRGVKYYAAIDPASRAADFVLVVLHEAPDETVVVDRMVSWAGTQKAPVPFEAVLKQIRDILVIYGVNTVVGDQFCADVIHQKLLQLGIVYEIYNFGTQTRAKLFANLKHLIVQGKIELPDDAELLRQLRSLREKKTERGHVDVRTSGGIKDDKAIALGLAANEPAKRAAAMPLLDLDLGDIQTSPALIGLIPGHCRMGAICENNPKCMDDNSCLGFKDERVTPSVTRVVEVKVDQLHRISYS